jgi:hypothetical protein
MKPLRNIKRMDDDSRSTHAWVVQVQRKGHIVIKMFSDSVHGGPHKALSAALEFRDALLVSPTPAEHNLWHRTIVRRNNKSGIPGIGLFARQNGTLRWIAYWTNEFGIRASRSFAVSVYGKNKAKQLAIEERERQLKRLFAIKTTQPR